MSRKAIFCVSLIFFVLFILIGIFVCPFTGSNPCVACYDFSKLDMDGYAKALELFRSDIGRYPLTAEGLLALENCPATVSEKLWHGPYIKNIAPAPYVCIANENALDPRGTPYRYTLTPQRPHGSDYEIVSAGVDAKFGTADDISNFEKETPDYYSSLYFYGIIDLKHPGRTLRH